MIGSFRLPISAVGTAPTEGWQRPSDWLEIDGLVNEGDEKFVGLHLITEDSNFLALSAQGDYTVDWGDGVVENYNSNVIAYHIFDWNDFLGTDTSRGYRQSIVTVTPQVAGTFTNINLQRKHNQSGLQSYSGGFVDIVMSSPNMTSGTVGGSTIQYRNLEQFVFKGSNLITNFYEFFKDCNSLQSVPLFDTSNGLNLERFFINCYSLQSVPLFDTSSATSMVLMFQNCYSLQSVPLFDTSNVTSMAYMFQNCYSLQSIPLFNTEIVANMAYMFENCYSLQSVPLFDTSSVTNLARTFSNCRSLISIPLLNVSLVSDFSITFNACYSLQKASLSGTNISISYNQCKLSADALADIFTNLATVTGGQTITITGNYGAALLSTAQREIATNKGWTIIG